MSRAARIALALLPVFARTCASKTASKAAGKKQPSARVHERRTGRARGPCNGINSKPTPGSRAR